MNSLAIFSARCLHFTPGIYVTHTVFTELSTVYIVVHRCIPVLVSGMQICLAILGGGIAYTANDKCPASMVFSDLKRLTSRIKH